MIAGILAIHAFLLPAWAGPAVARPEPARVEILLVERDGPGLADVGVGLDGIESSVGGTRLMIWRRTGAEGLAVFENLPPGTYRVRVAALAPPLVGPGDNPYARSPTITLTGDGQPVRLPVEIWRGSEVAVTIASNGGRHPRGRVLFREMQRGIVLESPVDETPEVERFLVPGLWEVAYEAEPGFLLVDVVRDRASLPGHAARLDLLADPRDTFLVFDYAAPSRVEGHVTFRGEPVLLKVEARLAEPGAWIDAARERGGSTFDRVEGRWLPSPPDTFEMILPDGTWSVRPVGPGLVSADPELHELRLLPGETARADFEVWTEKVDEGPTLQVVVTTPAGKRLEGAYVEVWAEGSRPPEGRPLAEGRTDRYGVARVTGLATGRYRVAAGHADFLDSEEAVPFDAEDQEGARVAIGLRRGTVVAVIGVHHAVEDLRLDVEHTPDGGPAVAHRDLADFPRGVTLDLETVRLDEPALLASRELAATRAHRSAVADDTGYLEIRGVPKGIHRLSARMNGSASARHWVVVREFDPDRGSIVDDGTGDELELLVRRDERRLIDLQVVPGGTISGTLVCRDGFALPLTASVRVISLDETVALAESGPEAADGTVLALDDVLLTGKVHDGFEAGPLREGLYRLAVRPTGFELWSWALGTPEPRRAAPLSLTPGAEVGVGPVEIDCGPQVGVWPGPAPGGARLDMDKAAVTARVRTEPETGRERIDEPEQQVGRDGVVFWELPEGSATLEVEVTHPHLLSEEPLRWTFELDLLRGKSVRLHPSPGPIGGTVVVDDAPVAAVLWGPRERLVDGTPTQRVATPDAHGRARFDHLEAGGYLAALCADAVCDGFDSDWMPVEVRAGEDARVRPDRDANAEAARDRKDGSSSGGLRRAGHDGRVLGR